MVRGVGADIVNHCIDDVLVQSARPLFFLDYIAASELDADLVAEVVGGMAEACEAAGCALLGGETAEMPGVYAPGAFDIAGTLVGIAERDAAAARDDVAAGDVLIGVASSGPHTNGFSFLRKLFDWLPMDVDAARLRPLARRVAARPHRSYLAVLGPAIDGGRSRRSPTSPAAGCPRTCRGCCPMASTPRSSSGRGPAAAVRLIASSPPASTPTSSTACSTWASGWSSSPPTRRDVQALIPEETWIIGELITGTPGDRTVHLITS